MVRGMPIRNWLGTIDFDPFQIAGVPEWGFSYLESKIR